MKRWHCIAVFIVVLSTTKYTTTKNNIFSINPENSIVSLQYENKGWLDAFLLIVAAVINFLILFSSCPFHKTPLIDFSDPHVSAYEDSLSQHLYIILQEKVNS